MADRTPLEPTSVSVSVERSLGKRWTLDRNTTAPDRYAHESLENAVVGRPKHDDPAQISAATEWPSIPGQLGIARFQLTGHSPERAPTVSLGRVYQLERALFAELERSGVHGPVIAVTGLHRDAGFDYERPTGFVAVAGVLAEQVDPPRAKARTTVVAAAT